MAEYLIQGETLSEIADAIREKLGTTGSITTSNMAAAISAIETSGGTSYSAETGLFSVAGDVATSWSFECSFEPSLLFIHAYKTTSDSRTPIYTADSAGVITWLAYDGTYMYTSEYSNEGMETYGQSATASYSVMTISYSNGTVTLTAPNGLRFGEGVYYHWIALKT